jgi:hypothetical protein
MSKKRLLAIIVLSATLAATGAIADVTHTSLDAANRGVAAQRDAEQAAIHRLLKQFRTIKIPLSEAVAIAEHLHDGSRTADVSFEMSGPLVPAQPVDATQALNLSAGVSNCKVSRGRSFS